MQGAGRAFASSMSSGGEPMTRLLSTTSGSRHRAARHRFCWRVAAYCLGIAVIPGLQTSPAQAEGAGAASTVTLELAGFGPVRIVSTTVDYDLSTRRYIFSGEVTITNATGFRLQVSRARVILLATPEG